MKTLKKIGFAVLAVSLIVPSLSASAASNPSDSAIKAVDGRTVSIKHLEKQVVSNQELARVVKEASQAIKEEKDALKTARKAASGTYNFISGGYGVTYIYEEQSGGEPVLTVADGEPVKVTEQFAVKPSGLAGEVAPYSVGTDFLKDGIGGKQNITLTNSSYMSTLLQLPSTASEGSWNYGGFDYNSGTAAYSGEMGLQYYTNLGFTQNLKGWKPVLTFVKTVGSTRTAYNVNFDSSYSQVQYRNGYVPGASINYYTYYNASGYVRMKLTGTAICADLNCNNPASTTLTTIMQTDQAVNLSSVNNYKLVTSIVTSATSGNNVGVFSSIKVGTTSVPSANFSAPLVDHATITRDANNTVRIACD